jgi:phosphoglycolate phosphatase-like HAD superfamily hydrolase
MEPPHQISCILFDMDQTLIEIPHGWHYFDSLIVEVVRDDFHLPVPKSSVRDTLWRSGKEYIQILRDWGIADHKAFWHFFDLRDAHYRKSKIEVGLIKPFPDTKTTLERLYQKGISMCVVTNVPYFLAEMELQAFSLQHYFQLILGLGDTQEICKPEPDGILNCMKQCNAQPSTTLMVGDAVVDLLAAKRAGVFPVLIDRDGDKKIEDPEIDEANFIRISSLEQILDWIG